MYYNLKSLFRKGHNLLRNKNMRSSWKSNTPYLEVQWEYNYEIEQKFVISRLVVISKLQKFVISRPELLKCGCTSPCGWTYWTPAVVGSRSGFLKLVKEKNPNIIWSHCIIHRQQVAAVLVGWTDLRSAKF